MRTLLLAGLLAAAAAAEPAIVIDPARILGPVNRLVLGQNAESGPAPEFLQMIFREAPAAVPLTAQGMWDPVRQQARPEVLALVRELGATTLTYPGGCLVHSFDWKRAIGPLAERPGQPFGLDEFIAYCRTAGAEPYLIVSDYTGTAQDAADLVEYCNAPADDRHPWARRRAAGGHPEPYRVRFFQLGNESNHGNHHMQPARTMDAEAYIAYGREYARAMRAVDPAIRISALVLPRPEDAWTTQVVAALHAEVDGFYTHTYFPKAYWDRELRTEQYARVLTRLAAVIEAGAGRPMPLSISEWNVSSMQDEQVSYGAALFCADYVRCLLEPGNRIEAAHFFQSINGAFGLVRSRERLAEVVQGGPVTWVRMPAYHMLRLWAERFGTRLVDTRVDGPLVGETTPPIDAPAIAVRPGTAKGLSWSAADGGCRLRLTQASGAQFPGFARAAVSPVSTYRVSFQARISAPLAGHIVGIGVMDSRGWAATRLAVELEGVQASSEWTTFSREIATLADTRELTLIWRVRERPAQAGMDAEGRPIAAASAPAAPADAEVEVRDLAITRLSSLDPAPALTAAGSLSADGRTAWLMVFNRHPAQALAVPVRLASGACAEVRTWTIAGPAFTAADKRAEVVGPARADGPLPGVRADGFTLDLPARSMTAVGIGLR